jgi:uncharacterized protein (TIGR02145 family)/uncharacterized repeat protein (TIGR02543 family)
MGGRLRSGRALGFDSDSVIIKSVTIIKERIMKKSIIRISITVFAVTAALLLAGCEDNASPNPNGYVDGFLVRVNQTPGSSGGGTGTGVYQVVVSSTGEGADGSGGYVVGTRVNIDAGTGTIGHPFVKWTTQSNGVTFANESNAKTSFTMPANNVTVTANFRTFPPPNLGTFTDSRDGKKYKTTIINGKIWMAENLNYPTSDGSWCYDDNNNNCNTYGRLYNWNTARTVCPAGYHLPSRDEWDALTSFAGGDVAGALLKAKSGWSDRDYGSSGSGTDDFGFSALPGGSRHTDGSFDDAGDYGYWWTATEDGGGYAYDRYMYYLYDDVHEGNGDVGYGFSVRCRED